MIRHMPPGLISKLAVGTKRRLHIRLNDQFQSFHKCGAHILSSSRVHKVCIFFHAENKVMVEHTIRLRSQWGIDRNYIGLFHNMFFGGESYTKHVLLNSA
jgi:hypothetical protein